jgi:hypothetical protein
MWTDVAAAICATILFMMRPSDSVLAGIIGGALLGAASYAVFGFKHGFEEQIGWYLMLLPGSIIAGGISDWFSSRTSESAAHLVFWGTLLLLNFLWYFAISFAAVKTYRFIFKLSRRP